MKFENVYKVYIQYASHEPFNVPPPSLTLGSVSYVFVGCEYSKHKQYQEEK